MWRALIGVRHGTIGVVSCLNGELPWPSMKLSTNASVSVESWITERGLQAILVADDRVFADAENLFLILWSGQSSTSIWFRQIRFRLGAQFGWVVTFGQRAT